MTLDEAIKHCLDIADGQDKCADISVSEHAKERISKCAADHRQLAEWLTELKEAKRLLKAAVEDMNINDICDDVNICNVCTEKNCISCDAFHWRYTDEALVLIGGYNG